MSVEERARLVLDPDMDKAIRALLSVIDTEKKVGDEAKSVAAKREQIEAEFSKKAFDLSHNRVEILKKEFSESLAEAEKYGAKRESIEKYYNKAINDARADALATQGQKLSQMGGALTLGVTTPLVAAGVAGLKFAASMESSAVKYGVLLGDMSKGIPFTEELKKLAAQTPLAFQGLDQAAQTLLGFQVSSDGLTDTLRMLGDLAKGNSEKLQGVALAYGQMSAAGRANMQDLNQLINAGVPILGALATSMGKPVPEIRKMVEEGKVGFSDVDKALKGLVDEGGLFHDMMKKVAETAEGKLSTALDSLKDAAGSAMESLIPLAKDLLEGVTGAAEKFSALDENSRRAILTILGMAAVAGPIMTATGGVMQLVAAYQKLDKAALVAKLTMLASNPVGWAIAGAAAIAGGVALINKAERDHEKALRDKAGAYKETAAEGAALAKEYQTLYDKTKLSADEQKRMVDLAQILKEKYPDLTQDTLNLAAANKTLADKVDEAALATARKAAGELLPKVESRYTQAVKELGNFSQILEKLKKLPDGGTYLGISKAETKTYEGYVAALRDEVAALQSDIETYKETLYGIPKNPNAKPIITPPSSGSNSSTTTTVKQGDRLAALDREYEARVALAKKLGEDVYSVEEEWAKKKYDMLQGFVLEDVKNGKSYETSLVLDLAGSYGALGTELDKAKEKLKEYARAQDDAALVASLSDNANETKWAAMAAETAAQVLALQEGVKLMEEKAATDKAIQDYLSDNANETKWAAMAAETAAQVLALQEGVKLMEERQKLPGILSGIGGQTGKALSAFTTLSNGLEMQFGIKLISDPAKDKLIAFVKDSKEGLQELATAGERLLGEMFLSIKDNAANALKEELAGIDDRIESYEKSSSRQLDILRKNGADTVAFELQMNAKKERLDKEKAAKEYAIGKKEFEIEKSSKLAEIAIATALGIAKAWANPITAPWVSALIGGMGIAQAAIVAGQQYPAAYEGAYAPGSSMGALVRIGERNQEEVVLPLRKSKLEELGLSGQTSGNMYIERVQFILPEGTSRDQALAMLDAFKGLKREGLLKGLVA